MLCINTLIEEINLVVTVVDEFEYRNNHHLKAQFFTFRVAKFHWKETNWPRKVEQSLKELRLRP